MKRIALLAALILAMAGLAPVVGQNAPPAGRALLPPDVLRALADEASGELALQNEILLAGVNRNREPEEYQKGYFETAFVLDRLREYGLAEAAVVDLPVRGQTTWDAEAGELWIVEPERRKIADLKELPASLAGGSVSTDTTAELVYVGPGNRDEHYEGKTLEGKIALVNGSPEMARRLAVEKHGAAGLLGWASSHAEHDRDQVGWNSIHPGEREKPTFAFNLSERQGNELRDALERGQKVVVRAVVKARQVPGYKEQMTVGLIKGTELPDEELVFTAHIFEGFAMQGANDNMSGVAAILETARVLRKLTAEGKLPPLKRSVRFLFVPEIMGTMAYLEKYPGTAAKFFAVINHDMVGEGLVKNLSFFRLYQTPWSLPTYLNDVAASFIEGLADSQDAAQQNAWLGSGAVIAPTGSRDPFYYRLEAYEASSDNAVFIDGALRVPAVFFNVWPDMWYHTSGDTPDKSDATQFKRVVTISAAAALFLANVGPAEAERMMADISARQLGRLGRDLAKAEGYLVKADAGTVHEAAKEARVVLEQAFARERETLRSVRFFLKGDAGGERRLASRLAALEGVRDAYGKGVDDLYAERCRTLAAKPVKAAPTPDELRLSRIVPVKTDKIKGMRGIWQMRDEIQKLKYQPPVSIMRSESELKNFMDGTRSVKDIRDAVSAEFEPLPLADVEKWVEVYEKLGLVTLRKK